MRVSAAWPAFRSWISRTIPLIISIDKMMTTLVPFLPELDFKQTSVMKETIANTNNITLKGLINARFIR